MHDDDFQTVSFFFPKPAQLIQQHFLGPLTSTYIWISAGHQGHGTLDIVDSFTPTNTAIWSK